MNFNKLRVLVTDGGGRQTLTIIHKLKELSCHIAVLCESKFDLCYASNVPEKKILDERSSPSHEDFDEFLLDTLRTGDYDVILPVAEGSTNRITSIEDEVKKYVKIAGAPRSSYINAFDKQRTFELAAHENIPIPNTRLMSQSVQDFLSTISFPLIIKPRNGVGSIGFHKFEKKEDFFPYIEKNNINLDDYVLQEFVDHEKRLGTILFMDQNGNVCMAYADEVLRWYPLDAGSACCIRSIDNPEIINWSSKLLKAMKWQGVAALSFMIDKSTGVPKLLEVNGRIPASIRLSSQCGFNVAKLLLELALGEEVESYPANSNYDEVTRHFHAEIPWFIASKERFKSNPSWFRWKKTKDVVFWKDDPMPWFSYTLQKLLGFHEFRKKRQH